MSFGEDPESSSAENGGWNIRPYVFGAFAILTAAAVGASMLFLSEPIPPRVYLFGFLGATVYVFTSLTEHFDETDQYALKLACRVLAVFPLSAGVYLLAFAFPGADGGVPAGERLRNGLVFLAGAYVSLTLKALGGLAKRMLGVSESQPETASESAGTGEDEPSETESQ